MTLPPDTAFGASIQEAPYEYGLGIDAFEKTFHVVTGKDVNFLTVAGYNAGLVIGKAIETADSLDRLALRKAIAGPRP